MIKMPVDERSIKRSLKSKFQLLLLIIVIVVSAIVIYTQVQKIHTLQFERQIVQKNIEKELLLNEKLRSEIDEIKSDELVERIARDMLGLIKEGDIIFVRPR